MREATDMSLRFVLYGLLALAGNAVAADSGGVYVVGSSMVAGQGSDCLTLKYDSEGGLAWTRPATYMFAGTATKVSDVLF